MISFSAPCISGNTPAEKKAAEILTGEIASRIDIDSESTIDFFMNFNENPLISDKDAFVIERIPEGFIFQAKSLRGFIFAIGRLLRKCEVKNNRIYISQDISGQFFPDKKIRGHQLGYRQTSNTYDAWDTEEYRRYYLDLMYFGVNTCEHIPYEKAVSDKNAIMKKDEQQLLCEASEIARELDMDVSLWYPNCEKDMDSAVNNRENLFSRAKKLDYIFPPGGDPGDLEPEELIERCKNFNKVLKKYHPHAGMWPSAQQPHHMPHWGTAFLKEMNKLPDFIDGVVTGPNAAFPLDILRKYLPEQYPVRLYPDITHNLRCEYPVHADRDDWHYALQTVNGRECANPRPSEYKKIHSDVRGYIIGSVSYSEGVNDDINKAVWSALDFDPDTPLREILEDYSRLFFPGSDYEKVADAVFGLEKNWEGAPEDNPQIEYTLRLWEEIGDENPCLYENWRFRQCLFRARTDAYVRRKVIFENSLTQNAKKKLINGDTEAALEILSIPAPEKVTSLLKCIHEDAKKLFELIGLQLGTEDYYAMNFERGAVLDTIKLPVTDLPWLLSRFRKSAELSEEEKHAYILSCFNRNKVKGNEYYYSVALHGITPGGVKQTKGFYMNVQGDRPDKNKGELPTALFKLFDHFSFRLKTCVSEYKNGMVLMITYRDTKNTDSIKHTVKINGNTVYSGAQFGGQRNTDYEKDMLPEGFIAVQYNIDPSFIINGCIDLQITEPVNGFEIAELRFTEKPYASGIWRGKI